MILIFVRYSNLYRFLFLSLQKRSRPAKKSNQIKSWKGWYLENKAIGKCIIANALDKISLAHPRWESEWMFRYSKALTSERKPFDILYERLLRESPLTFQQFLACVHPLMLRKMQHTRESLPVFCALRRLLTCVSALMVKELRLTGEDSPGFLFSFGCFLVWVFWCRVNFDL